MWPWLIAGLLLTLSLTVSIKQPFWSIVGLAALIPFDRALELAQLTVYTNELYLLGLGASLIWQIIAKKITFQSIQSYLWPAWPFLFFIILSIWHASDQVDVFKQLLRWCEFFLVYLLLQYYIKTKNQFYILLSTTFIFGIISSILGIIQNLAGIPLSAEVAQLAQMNNMSDVVRAYATFGHPNQFAGYLVLLVPLAFELFLENENLKYQILMGVVTIALGLALIMTYSRGGWISALLGVVIILIYYIPRNIVKSTILFLVFIVLIMLLPSYLVQLNNRVAGLVNAKKDTAVSGRLFYQKVALSMIKEHPITGHGAGNYPQLIERYKPVVKGDIIYLDKHIHNLYAQITIETGILGLIGFLFFILMFYLRLGHGFKHAASVEHKAMILTLGASSFAFLFHNNFDVLMIYARGIHFALIMGLGLVFIQLETKPLTIKESVNHGVS